MHQKLAVSVWISAASAIVFASFGANACGMEDYTGSICVTAARYCPMGKVEANGQLLPIAPNGSLFQLFGTTYGGDGVSTFGVPDLRGRTAIGRSLDKPPTGAAQVNLGEPIGSPSVTISSAQLAPHTHPFNSTPAPLPVNVTLQASSGPADATGPSSSAKYLAATTTIDPTSGGVVVQTWASSQTSPVEVGGLSATISGNSGSAGGGQPVITQSPSLGLLYCVETRGTFPPQQ